MRGALGGALVVGHGQRHRVGARRAYLWLAVAPVAVGAVTAVPRVRRDRAVRVRGRDPLTDVARFDSVCVNAAVGGWFGGGAVTVTDCVVLLVAPLSSVTVSVTV